MLGVVAILLLNVFSVGGGALLDRPCMVFQKCACCACDPSVHLSVPSICFVVVVCPLQPSSSVNSGCPGPESSVLLSSRWACPISSQVTGHWGELCNRTGEVHPVDPFHSLDILKNHFASVAFCRNSGVYNVQN